MILLLSVFFRNFIRCYAITCICVIYFQEILWDYYYPSLLTSREILWYHFYPSFLLFKIFDETFAILLFNINIFYPSIFFYMRCYETTANYLFFMRWFETTFVYLFYFSWDVMRLELSFLYIIYAVYHVCTMLILK